MRNADGIQSGIHGQSSEKFYKYIIGKIQISERIRSALKELRIKVFSKIAINWKIFISIKKTGKKLEIYLT